MGISLGLKWSNEWPGESPASRACREPGQLSSGGPDRQELWDSGQADPERREVRKTYLWKGSTKINTQQNKGLWVTYCVLVAQSCPTLCDPMDCSPPGSSVHGILQARILEWVAISFSRGSS